MRDQKNKKKKSKLRNPFFTDAIDRKAGTMKDRRERRLKEKKWKQLREDGWDED